MATFDSATSRERGGQLNNSSISKFDFRRFHREVSILSLRRGNGRSAERKAAEACSNRRTSSSNSIPIVLNDYRIYKRVLCYSSHLFSISTIYKIQYYIKQSYLDIECDAYVMYALLSVRILPRRRCGFINEIKNNRVE